MTTGKADPGRVAGDPQLWAAELTAHWASSPNETHKRPPFRAHSFDDDERFCVVGTTMVSVLHGWHASKEAADRIAALLNDTPAVRQQLRAREIA